VRQNEIKKLQTCLLALFQPHFSGVKPDGPDVASISGSPEAAPCQEQERSSHCIFLGVVSLCQRQDRGESCDPMQAGSSFWGPLRDVLAMVGLGPSLLEWTKPNFPPRPIGCSSLPPETSPVLCRCLILNLGEQNVWGTKLLSCCLKPAVVPLQRGDFHKGLHFQLPLGLWRKR